MTRIIFLSFLFFLVGCKTLGDLDFSGHGHRKTPEGNTQYLQRQMSNSDKEEETREASEAFKFRTSSSEEFGGMPEPQAMYLQHEDNAPHPKKAHKDKVTTKRMKSPVDTHQYKKDEGLKPKEKIVVIKPKDDDKHKEEKKEKIVEPKAKIKPPLKKKVEPNPKPALQEGADEDEELALGLNIHKSPLSSISKSQIESDLMEARKLKPKLVGSGSPSSSTQPLIRRKDVSNESDQNHDDAEDVQDIDIDQKLREILREYDEGSIMPPKKPVPKVESHEDEGRIASQKKFAPKIENHILDHEDYPASSGTSNELDTYSNEERPFPSIFDSQ